MFLFCVRLFFNFFYRREKLEEIGMSKRKPILLASSLPSKRVTKSVAEPPVKTVENTESEDESPEPVAPSTGKKSTPFTIPTAQELQRERQEALDREKKEFIEELIHNFERNARAGGNSFVICYDVRYKWQYSCMEHLFKPKGYDITYKNVRDYDEDRTFAELRIPHSIDAKEPFQV